MVSNTVQKFPANPLKHSVLGGLFGTFLGLIIILGMSAPTGLARADGVLFNPRPIVRAESPAVLLEGIDAAQATDLKILFNRGEQSASLLNEILEMTSPKYLRTMKGFRSPRETQITFMTYEINSIEVIQRIEELLEAEFHVRVIYDSSTTEPFQSMSATEWRKLSTHQKQYLLNALDKNQDGKISKEELQQANQRHALSQMASQKLKEIQKKHKANMQLVGSPLEIVPQGDNNYIRLTHLKLIRIDHLKSGKWRPQEEIMSSANLTHTCLDRRLLPRASNYEKYLNGEKANFVRGSEGHVQFGIRLKGESLIDGVTGPIDQWIEAFQHGKHFDSLPAAKSLWPEVIWESKNGSYSLQSFYSEGRDLKTVDPVWALSRILSREDITLTRYYDAQFVFTHKVFAQHLRHHLSRSKLDDFAIFVDGNFSTELYSSLSQLFFAPMVHNQRGVLSQKSIRDFFTIPEALNWESKVFSYDGHIGISGGEADKLHSKLTYLEYTDSNGATHGVIAWGSANKSNNAGQLNADGLRILDTTDARVIKQMRGVFDTLRNPKQMSNRMLLYSEEYIRHRLVETLGKKDRIDELKIPQKWRAYLSQPKANKSQLSAMVAELKKLKAENSFGRNLLELLDWFAQHRPQHLTWAEFYLLTYAAHPKNKLQEGFVKDLIQRWAESGAQQKALTALLKKLERGQEAIKKDREELKYLDEIFSNCEVALSRISGPDLPKKYYQIRGKQ